jgi:TP901 family phage tail tape measure protein/lambda family phage tail tape measure protein
MATFRINIVVNPTSAVAGTRVVERRLSRIENQANRLRRTLGLTFAALAGGAFIFGAVRNMAAFSESIAVVRAVTKATAEQFEELETRARDLGRTTRFTATEAADAMVLLARAGLSVDETMTAVGDTLLLAQAGSLAMAEAADITASSMRGFGLEAEEVARITDVLTETANSSNTNVSQLGQSLKFVAPIARGLGQQIEITNAALGTLADAGLKGTLAGTGLRRVLAELASPGRELQDILTEAGLIMEDVDPKVVGLTNALEALKLAGFDTGDALEVFGQRGGPAFAVLVNNIPKIRALEKALMNSGGEAKRVAGIMDRTLFGALKRAQAAIESLNLAMAKAGGAELLSAILEGITVTFRFLSRNAETLATIIGGILVAASLKLAIVLVGKLVPAFVAASTAAVTMKGTIIAAGLAIQTLGNSVAIAIPPFLAFAAATAALIHLSKVLTAEWEAVEKAHDELVKDAPFGQIGKNITLAAQELKKLERIVAEQRKRGIGPSPAQEQRMAKLTLAMRDNALAAREQLKAQREQAEREKRNAPVTEAAIARLERRKASLEALTQRAKELVAYQAQLNTLEQEGAIPTTEEKARIRILIRENEELAVQQRIFEEIKGPQMQHAENVKALKALHDKGAISAGEYAIKLQELNDAVARDVEPVVTELDKLEQENKLLARRLEIGNQLADMEELRDRLKRDGISITDSVMERIARAILLRDELRQKIKDQTEAQKALERAQEEEERQLDRLERRIKSQEALRKEMSRLKVLFDANRLSLEEFTRAMENVQLKGLETSTSLEDGFSRAFIKMRREAENLAKVGEDIMNVFADQATDALVEFATTGRFVFKEFASAILEDLIRITARLLIMQALSGFTGGNIASTAPAIGSALAGSRQEGGTVQPNRSFVVGENGPELFVPDRTGTIVPNQKDQPQAQPTTVQVVNVSSEEEIPDAINTGGSDEAIINVLARNRDRVNQVIQ